MNTSRIQVYRNNRPASGVRVRFGYDGLTQIGLTQDYYTDDQGVAYVQHSSTGWATVYLDGREQSRKVYTPGEEVYYI
jgi:hypothetical protein